MVNQPLRQLTNITSNLDVHFSINDFEPTIKIKDFPQIFFDDNAGGKVAGGSCNWLKNKHKNKSVHEPATIGAFLFVQRNFSSQINVIFDIGALYGYFSLISKSLFSHATVFSFEMNPNSYSALCRNINVNKHLAIPATHCINVGLSEKTCFQKKVTVDNFILEELDENISGDSSVMDIISLDDFCHISGHKPDLIKMDVEGYQAKIIPGAMRTITKKRPIIILEFDAKQQLQKFSTTNKEVVKPLFDLGYTCYWCSNQRKFNSEFELLTYDNFSDLHEANSLGVFVP